LAGFGGFLKEKGLTLPEWWPEQETLRVLHAANFQHQKAFNDINIIVNWRAQNLPIKLDANVVKIIRSGFFTIFGRDKHCRPVVICRPLALGRIKAEGDTAAINSAICFVAFYVMNYMLKEG
jgi:hypothetical protein